MKKLRWLIENGVIVGGTLLALIYGYAWAGRIASFAVIALAILATIAWNSPTLRREAREKGTTWPFNVSAAFEILLLLLFVGAGWWVTAIFQLWGLMVFSAVHHPDIIAKERQKEALASNELWAVETQIEFLNNRRDHLISTLAIQKAEQERRDEEERLARLFSETDENNP